MCAFVGKVAVILAMTVLFLGSNASEVDEGRYQIKALNIDVPPRARVVQGRGVCRGNRAVYQVRFQYLDNKKWFIRQYPVIRFDTKGVLPDVPVTCGVKARVAT